MPLAVRIIPQLLYRGNQLIKGEKFNSWRSVGTVSQAVRVHQMRGVDELMLLDISATKEGRGPDLELVKGWAESCFMPLSVGGGVRSLSDVRELLRHGADKVVIGTYAIEKPDRFSDLAEAFGNSTFVVSIDVRVGKVVTRSGTNELSGLSAISCAKMIEDAGAGEILINSIDREGTMSGYDLSLINAVSEAVSVPVVAAGGCGTYEHMYEAIMAGANAVAAGAMFQFTDMTPRGAAEYLRDKGVVVRL